MLRARDLAFEFALRMMRSLFLGAAIMAIRRFDERRAATDAGIAEAQKLADSGAYHDYTDIEYVLRFDYGLSRCIDALLDSQLMHRDPQPALCGRAGEGRGGECLMRG